MFRELLARLQEALHKQQLVYCARVLSVGCYQGWIETGFILILLTIGLLRACYVCRLLPGLD
jgi:hypothetical protein